MALTHEMPSKWWVLTSVACGTFMATLDASIVNIGLPTITSSLNTDLLSVRWVVVVYLLVITCLLLPIGRLADQFGRKTVFQWGYIVFSIGSALCGWSTTLTALVTSRALQGVGAAMLMANGPALITASFDARERGKALGTLAMVVSFGLLAGPGLGGFLITRWDWPAIFWINIPFGIMGMLLARRFVRREIPYSSRLPFDWLGAVLQTFVLLLLLVLVDPPMISLGHELVVNFSRPGLFVAFLILTVVFLKVEARAKAPVLDLSLFRNRIFWTANLAAFLLFIATASLSVLMPFFLEHIMAYTPARAGLLMTAIPLTIFFIAPLSGRISDRYGTRGVCSLGALMGALGLFIMSGLLGAGLNPQASSTAIILSLCLMGLAIGLFQSPNNSAIMGAVPSEKLGTASALLATVRNLGLVIGTGSATALFSWRHQITGDFVGALHFVLTISGCVGLGALLAAMSRSKRSREIG